MIYTKSVKGISVIICCYNSVLRLYETLKHLALQETGSLSWEIVIVDNASTDNTASFAKETWEGFKRDDVVLTIVSEKQQGLSFARKAGVQAAAYEYIIFCDDDNWLNKDYIQTAFNLIDADKTIGAIGGISTAASDVEFPEWFTKYQDAYAVGKQGDKTGIVNERGYVCGAGLVTRKSVFQNTINDMFPSMLCDRKGKELLTGGDVEYCLRLILQGFDIWYNEALVFVHFIPSYRLTEEYRETIFKGVEASRKILNEYFEAIKIKHSDTGDRMKLSQDALKDILKSYIRQRKPQPASYKLFFYLFNIGFKNRPDLQVIKQFYNFDKKLNW